MTKKFRSMILYSKMAFSGMRLPWAGGYQDCKTNSSWRTYLGFNIAVYPIDFEWNDLRKDLHCSGRGWPATADVQCNMFCISNNCPIFTSVWNVEVIQMEWPVPAMFLCHQTMNVFFNNNYSFVECVILTNHLSKMKSEEAFDTEIETGISKFPATYHWPVSAGVLWVSLVTPHHQLHFFGTWTN